MAEQDNVFAQYGGTALAEPPSPTATPTTEMPTSDPFSRYGGHSLFETKIPEAPVQFQPAKAEDIFTAYGGKSLASSQSELDKPETNPQLQSKSETPDPNAPWYKKIWESANAPLFDAETAKNWFGWDVDHWAGWGKGLFDLASSLTSPLSLALGVASLGEYFGVELGATGGVAALKAAGMTADKIGEVAKGSEIMTKAIKMGHDAEMGYAAMARDGIDPQMVKDAYQTLTKAGVRTESLLAKGVIHRTGGAMLRGVGFDVGMADKISQWTQLAADAGFTLQNGYAAVITAPQVLDALKEGDTDTATRLAIDAAGMGAFALLGTHQAHQHAGELMTDAEAAAGLRVKPSDENIKVAKLLGERERERILSGEREKAWEKEAEKLYPEFRKPEKGWVGGGKNWMDLMGHLYRASEGNLDAVHDAIADAAGRPEEKIIKQAAPETVEHYDLEKMESKDRHDFINKNINTRLKATNAESAKAEIDKLLSEGLIPKSFNSKLVSYTDADGKLNYGVKWIPKTVAEASNLNAPADVERLQEAAAQKLFGKSYKDLDPTNIKDRMAAINEAIKMQAEERLQAAAKVDTTFPPEIQDAIDSAKLKDKPKAYIDQLLKATDSKLLTDRIIDYSKHTGLHFDETLTRSIGEGTLHAGAEAYVTRIAKKADDSNVVKKFRSVASSPDFSLDTAMARKRIFHSTLEFLLHGYELEDHDMIALAAHNGNEFSRVAAERQFANRLRGAGARVSDGRNMAVLAGSGHVIEGMDREGNPVNPATIINPKGMQSIPMADKVADAFKRNVIRPGAEEVKAGQAVTPSTVTPEAFLRRVGEAKGVMERHNVELEEKFKAANGQWPSDVPPVKLILDESGNVIEADGRYRAALANQAGIERIPVEVSRPTPAVKGTPAFTELDKLIKEGKVVNLGPDKRGVDKYAYTARDYKTVDNPAFRGVKVPTVDTNGNPIFVYTEYRFHPEVAEYIDRVFGRDRGMKDVPGVKQALWLGREAKGWLLALSPFHIMQEALRAVMTGISPIGLPKFNPENPMHVLAAENGVWATKDYSGVRAYEDSLAGHSKTMNKVPVLREIQDWTQSFLFDRYIPALKLRAFERMYEANERLHTQFPELTKAIRDAKSPQEKSLAVSKLAEARLEAIRTNSVKPEWTKAKLAKETADEVNERFGGIDYKRIGRKAGAMDLARLTTLAPDWLESEMRFMKRTFTPGAEGTLARRDVLKMTLGLWAAVRVLNYITTGQAHNEAPFGVAVKDEDGREKVYGIRTMPGDFLHAIQDPLNFMNGRTSPLLKTGIQTYTGRNEFGQKMSTNGIFVNLLRNVAPIGLQTLAKQATGDNTEGTTNIDALAKASGLTEYGYRTEAQKEAAKLASSHTESGEIDQSKLKRNQYMIHLENQVRAGRVPITDVYKGVESGTIHVDEAKRMVKTIQETASLDPESARLYAHVSRLPFSDVISVFEKATNEEKNMLAKLLLKKKQNYLKKVNKEMSQQERNSDPSYIWIRRHFPNEAPW